MTTGHSFALTRAICLAWLLVATASLSAFELRKGKDIYVTGDFQEDLLLWGSTVNFDGTINGDVLAGANSVTINGSAEGNVMAVARRVTVNGEIHRSLRCAAQTVNIASKVDGDAIAFAADITLGNDAVVGRDVALFAGEVFLDGTVGGKAYISGGTVTIAGKIDGDLTVKGDNITVTPDAVIGGEFNYTSKEKANIAPEAQITGEVKWKKKARSESSGAAVLMPPPTGVIWTVIFLIGSLVLGGLMILIKRERVLAVVNEIKTNAALDGLIGLAVLIVVPIFLTLIGITLVGIPIAVSGLAAYLIIFMIAKIFVGIALGMMLLRLFKKEGKVSLGWSLAIGMLLLALLFKIPVLSWILYFVAWAIGAGAITILLFKRKGTSTAT